MFTGIVEEIGQVQALIQKENLAELHIRAAVIFKGIKLGESVNTNGVCLTVADKKKGILVFEMMLETLEQTNLKNLKSGAKVNLERALKADSRFGGHFVTGHVDGLGRIERIIKKKNFVEFKLHCDQKYIQFIVPKGSVALEGVSLTVGKTEKNRFSVYLIPFTLKVTTLGTKKAGDWVNMETDLLAKYLLTKKKRS